MMWHLYFVKHNHPVNTIKSCGFLKISSCAFIIRVEITLIYDMQLKCDMHVVFCLFVALES